MRKSLPRFPRTVWVAASIAALVGVDARPTFTNGPMPAAVTTTTIADGLFNPADWSQLPQISGGASQTLLSGSSGGNPGSYRAMRHTFPGGTSSVAVWHMYDRAVFNPSSQGAIDTIDYIEDYFDQNGGFGGVSSIAIQQNGTLYRLTPASISVMTPGTAWRRAERPGLRAIDFTPTSPPLNFSATGTTMKFGYFRFHANSGPQGYETDHGIDNWQVTIRSLSGSSSPPFGSVDTPVSGTAGVTGAIAMTGWALDDVGLSAVRIMRDPVPPEPAGMLISVGTALRIPGARPDVAALYPTTPENNKAGWGYMLLTNMLPGGGNGSYTFHFYADDSDGQATLLGTRTIGCSNATATKPFGAIDSPTPGQLIQPGVGRVVTGWVLTPLPKTVPIDGSTIQLDIDGVVVWPRASYNQARSDIASLFPGRNNSSGAGAASFFHITALADGMHTMQWVVTDNLGVSEGIGARFFAIQNTALEAGLLVEHDTAADRMAHRRAAAADLGAAMSMAPVGVREGYPDDSLMNVVWPDVDGVGRIDTYEVTRLVVELDEVFGSIGGTRAAYRGYLRSGGELTPLPIGSNLDRQKGRFSWLPGPGFIGRYDLVFIRTTSGSSEQIRLAITLQPARW